MPRLVLIGLVAGFFAALFGVGGGILVVPLLTLAARSRARPARGTARAGSGVTAPGGVIASAALGRVDPALGALVGVPAALGAVAGTAVQQRLATRALSLAFAALLVVIAALLLIA